MIGVKCHPTLSVLGSQSGKAEGGIHLALISASHPRAPGSTYLPPPHQDPVFLFSSKECTQELLTICPGGLMGRRKQFLTAS